MIEKEQLELEPLRATLREAVKYLPPQIRYRAENAFNGFARSRALLALDREMASFRAITAQEEAAAALFRSLQLRNYPGAEQLNLKLHQHKAAVSIFLAAINHTIAEHGAVKLNITLQANPPKVTVGIPISQFSGCSKMTDFILVNEHPLGGIATRPGVDQYNYFDDAVNKVSDGRNVDKLISQQANSRTRLLYAHDTGIPESRVTADGIDNRERQAEICILISIAIMQTDVHQTFAMQCLGGFLKIIRRSHAEVYT